MPKKTVLGGVLAMAALFAAPTALAATVEVREQRGDYNSVKLRFDAAPGESNHVTTSIVGDDGDYFEVEVVDPDLPIDPGAGCSGGGSPGIGVTCQVHKPHLAEFQYCGRSCALYISGTAWSVRITVALGDGDNSFDASSLPGVGMEAFDMTVTAGDGNDVIATAAGEDRVEPGAGADQVRTGAGSDGVMATSIPDAADLYDLGGDGFLDYSRRMQPVFYRADAEANDGAPGEGDAVLGAPAVITGSGDDVLIGGLADEHFVSGAGNDQLSGGGGHDDLSGEAGDNLLSGGEGNDRLAIERLSPPLASSLLDGTNRADGGPGDDHMYLGAGPDEAVGGPGNDVIKLGDSDDLAAGGTGKDRIYGDHGDDLVAGEDDADQLIGGYGADRLLGGNGTDGIVAGVAAHALPGNILKARGPIDGWRDSVGCGPGADVASINPWDMVGGCEAIVYMHAVYFRQVRIDKQTGAIMLPVVVASPGRLVLYGGQAKRQTRSVLESHFDRPFPQERMKVVSLPLILRPRARRTLRRKGYLRLAVKVSFQPDGGIPRRRTKTFHIVAFQ